MKLRIADNELQIQRTQSAARKAGLPLRIRHSELSRAFTLIEVMFAIAVFCTAMFTILALVANSLAGARNLQRPMVDAGEIASILSQTNLVEGTYHENLGEILGDSYNRYDCTYVVEEVQSNKLFQVDFLIQDSQSDSGNPVSKMSVLLYSPSSQPGSMDPGGTTLHP